MFISNKQFQLFLKGFTVLYWDSLVSKIGTDSTIRTPAEPMEFSAISEAAMD
jgi:hypothetical protein